MRTNKRTFPAAELVRESDEALPDLGTVFGRTAQLEVDLGCGDGTFLAARAAELSERNFLGVEWSAGRFRGACRKIGDGQLSNARVLRGEILETVKHLLPRESVEVFHLLFPDPWPKRRHHNRRIVTEEFLQAVADGLVRGGSLRIATDHSEYFAFIERVLLRVPAFVRRPAGAMDAAFSSTFESRFRASGAEIHRLVLQKPMPGSTDCRAQVRP